MKKIIIFLLLVFLFPFNVFAEEELINNALSGILIEASSGKIYYQKDKDKRVSVASMTKMVAQIIILDEVKKGNIKWDDVVTVSHNASGMGGSQIYLEEGEKITVRDLMKGISVASGNDAVVAMAEYISGSEAKFVERMNKVVKKLGLKNTHFVNSTGLDQENHYSSSYDMAMIARELVVNYPEVLEFSSIYEDYLREDSDNKFWLVNTNKLISQYEGTDGLKTGHTDDAGYCLAATTKRNNLRLIAIVLGEKDSKVRNKETMELLDYGFNNIKVKKLKNKHAVIKSVQINRANKKSINALLKEDLIVTSNNIHKQKYKYKVELNNIKLPIKKGQEVGKISVLVDNRVVLEERLISSDSVKQMSFYELYTSNLRNLVLGEFS